MRKEDFEKQIEAITKETLEKLENPPSGSLESKNFDMLKEVNLVVSAERELTKKLGKKPSNAEIALETNLSEERVGEIKNIAPTPMEID